MDSLTDTDWKLRAEVYRLLIVTFEAPGTEDLAQALGISATDVEAGLLRLERNHLIVLASGETRPWMVHPFSTVPTEYPVETDGGRYWANCAWDSLGIPAVIGRDTWTRTRCAETGEPIEYGIRDGKLVAADAVIHFAVPARRWYDNVAFT